MRKPKIACFRYKRYNDVYVTKAFFSIDILLSILDSFLDQKILVLIESDEVQKLSSISKRIGTMEVMPCSQVSRFLVICNKTELLRLLNQVKINDFEGMFMANIKTDIALDEFICSLGHTANSMVKDGKTDVSISINFPENQMVISLSKEKYEVMSIKDKIYSIFKD